MPRKPYIVLVMLTLDTSDRRRELTSAQPVSWRARSLASEESRKDLLCVRARQALFMMIVSQR